MVQKNFLFHTIEGTTAQASELSAWEWRRGGQERQGRFLQILPSRLTQSALFQI